MVQTPYSQRLSPARLLPERFQCCGEYAMPICEIFGPMSKHFYPPRPETQDLREDRSVGTRRCKALESDAAQPPVAKPMATLQ